MNAIEIRNLTKSFSGFKLDNLNLTLPRGCIMGLIGENGAGKSTTIKLILGALRADTGSISLLGRDSREMTALEKENIGIVLDGVSFPQTLTLRQIERMFALSYTHWDAAEFERLIKKFDLTEDWGKKFKDFSRGMRMKLGIAAALSHGAKLLILDEATAGLDPVVRDEVLDILNDFTRDEAHSVLISSHIVSDLEKLCDYIAFLHKGQLMLCEEKDVLLSEYGILRCAKDELRDLGEGAVLYRRETPYSAELLVRRDALPCGMEASPVSIEELFILMIKSADTESVS